MMPRISSSEWEVMSVVWSREPLTAAEVFERLPSGHGWKQKTVNTFLTRLVSKGILEADKKGKAFLYSSTVAKEKCIQVESDSFLKRVFQGATGELMLHFCERADLTPDEIKELEQLLRTKKGRK